MATPAPVQDLLDAVRRRLWRRRFMAGVRLALWASAGLMLLGAAVHLAVRPVAAGTMLAALTAGWAAMLAWAGWRRPCAADCALWADRHLGGASAFTTLLEAGRGPPAAAQAQAVQWLERWAASRVPDGLRLLAGRQEPAQLSRPLASALVGAALATVVLTLPDPAPASRPEAALPTASGNDDGPMHIAESPASAEAVGEIELALRSAASTAAPERRAGQAPAAGAGRPGDGEAPAQAQAPATPAGARQARGGAVPGTAVDAGAATGTTAGSGSGRQAGDSPDDRADVGVSRALQGTMTVQRSASSGRRSPGDEQADLERSAEYDDRLAVQDAAAAAAPAPAAATPPAAAGFARLAPTEATYVQAWMKANAARR
jgi:hypothetical protein